MLIREATPDDIAEVAKTSISRGCSGKQPEVVDYVFALEHEGKILATGGIKLITPTTAWTWFDFGQVVLNYKHRVYRIVRDWLDSLVKIHKLTRLMAAVDTTFPEAIRMVEHLDFQRESTMPFFFGQLPAYLYVRYYEQQNDNENTTEL